ncbi:MAG: serine/threonine-protein phosphatase [Lachnospiraceae bacterium]|nr:serine/threonine-protein phosphatase [Lachnospiraceae bacterium]
MHQVFYYSDKGVQREINEDNFWICGTWNRDVSDHISGSMEERGEEFSLYAVFDGMGGEECGEKASAIAAEVFDGLHREAAGLKNFDAFEMLLSGYVEEAKKKILHVLEKEGALIGGTTISGIAIYQKRILPFWIGDSRIYLLKKSGGLSLLSRDETIAWKKMAHGEMTEEEARNSRYWHVLTNYLGEEEGRFSLGEEETVEEGDRILLLSDGITDRHRDMELKEVFSESFDRIEETLADWVEHNGEDNGTVVMIII